MKLSDIARLAGVSVTTASYVINGKAEQQRISSSTVDRVRAVVEAHGFTQDDVWDIAGISAFFGMSNRIANVTNMRPNAEFYALGR